MARSKEKRWTELALRSAVGALTSGSCEGVWGRSAGAGQCQVTTGGKRLGPGLLFPNTLRMPREPTSATIGPLRRVEPHDLSPFFKVPVCEPLGDTAHQTTAASVLALLQSCAHTSQSRPVPSHPGGDEGALGWELGCALRCE